MVRTIHIKVTLQIFILDHTEEWVGSLKAIEEINVLCSKGNISHTHPQLIQDAYAKFSKLTPERFKYIRRTILVITKRS